jgi:hypothetical protein
MVDIVGHYQQLIFVACFIGIKMFGATGSKE